MRPAGWGGGFRSWSFELSVSFVRFWTEDRDGEEDVHYGRCHGLRGTADYAARAGPGGRGGLAGGGLARGTRRIILAAARGCLLVVSDRTVIDTQLQEAIFDFERTTGIVAVVKGEGAEIVDVDGKRYFDALSGLWNVHVGHGRDRASK